MISPSQQPLVTWKAFAAAFAVAAFFALTSRYPGFVHHDTSEIVMWSDLGFPLGLPKHPPFMPWLFHIVSFVVPLNWATLSLMSAANIVIGAWAVWCIARLYLSEERAAVALLLYALGPGGTFFALKLNHNAILVSLWPLTMLAFLLCLRARSNRESLIYGAVFGTLAAASMLAKYYSGVMLASCLIGALVSPYRTRFIRAPGGYVAVAVFLALIAPHVMWVLDHRGDTLAYAFHESTKESRSLFHFIGWAPFYLLPAMAAHLALTYWLPGPIALAAVNRKIRTWRELWALAILPFVLTALIIGIFRLRGATSWAIPDFAIAPVLLAIALPPINPIEIQTLTRWAKWALIVIAACGPIALAVGFAAGDANTTEPRAEIATAAGQIFKEAAGTGPRIVSGDPHMANSAAIAIASRPTVFTGFSFNFSPWIAPAMFEQDGLLALCGPNTAWCRPQAAAIAVGRAGFVCNLTRRRHLFALKGKPFTVEITVMLPRHGAITPEAGAAACAKGGPGSEFVRMLN